MSDILSSVSLLLALLTFMFNLAYPRITQEIDKPLPPQAQKEERKIQQKGTTRLIFFGSLPILLSFIALFYINLPKSIEILSTSIFNIWNFSIIPTMFIMIELAVLGFSVLNIWCLYKLIKRWRDLKSGT